MPQPRRTTPPTTNVGEPDTATEPVAGTEPTTDPAPESTAGEQTTSSPEPSSSSQTDDAPATELASVLNVSLTPVDLPSGAIVPPGETADGVDLSHPEARRRVDSGELLHLNQENPS